MTGAAPKVLFVSRKWAPAMGGMETYSVELCRALEPHVALDRLVLSGREDGRPPALLALLGWGMRSALRLLTQRDVPDVVHLGDMAIWPLGYVARLRSARTRVVLSAHGTDVSFGMRPGLVGKLYGIYQRLGARLLRRTRVMANSAATAEGAASLGWREITICPLATTWQGADSLPEGPRRRLLYSGRILPLKGLRWFVEEVLPRLPEDIGLDVAGTVWDRAEAVALDHPRVAYLGRLAPEDLGEAYASALAVVVPNTGLPAWQFEGFGLVALEAAAAGGVAVASDHGGLRDAVRSGETGFLLPVRDAGAWAKKIREVAAWSGAEREDFVSRSLLAVDRTYRWDRVAQQVLAAYRG